MDKNRPNGANWTKWTYWTEVDQNSLSGQKWTKID